MTFKLIGFGALHERARFEAEQYDGPRPAMRRRQA